MHKKVSALLILVCFTLLCFTLASAVRFVRSENELPQSHATRQPKYRLVLVTSDLGTPFWQKVSSAAEEQASQFDAALEVWGSYGGDRESFLKQLEIAIDSRVDGIIVQGQDTDEFKNLTKVKAAFYGIPIITVASDVPMNESMRKTYVGSDPVAAGQQIARQLIQDMGTSGTVVVMGDNREEYDQRQRLKGITSALKPYPQIHTEYVKTPEVRERIVSATQDAMNRLPNVDAFITIDSGLTEAMIQEISRRSKVESYYIYSFDDSPDVLPLLKEAKLDGVLQQSPGLMGKVSVEKMIQWLNGTTLPLNGNGYMTDFEMSTAADTR